MKIIRFVEVKIQERPDGRTVRNLLQKELDMDVSGLQMLYVTHPHGLEERQHSHDHSCEILYFLDKARYKINGQDYLLNENDVVLFEPGDIHGAIPIDNETRIIVFQSPIISDDKKYH